MSVKIPKSGLEALAALLQATPKFLDAFYLVLKKSKPRLQWADLESEILTDLRGFPEVKRETIQRVLSMFNGVIYAADDESVPDTVTDLMESARATGDARFSAAEKNWGLVKSFLEKVLALDQLRESSKALSLFSDTARHMHGARLLTDARPMYSDNPDAGPIAFVIIHTLRLDYYENGRTKDWYLALDRDDLETLRDVVDRAIRKEKSLQECLKKTETDVFTYRDESDGRR